MVTLVWLLGCGAPPDDPGSPTDDARAALAPTDQLVRISMALRGLRPSVDDLTRVEADPTVLEDIVDAYLDDPAFGATVRDMHAELLRVRVDVQRTFLARGALTGEPQLGIDASVAEGPLKLVEAVVMDDRPYTDIVTSDEVWVNDRSAEVWGASYDPSGAEWQASQWPDGRPAAGLLADSAIFARHMSVGGNAHRGRAELMASALLCQSFLERDVTADGSIDLADEAAVANAVETNESCVSCHQALDPLAASFWPHLGRINSLRISFAYDDDGQCVEGSPYCYPIAFWRPELTNAWRFQGLRAPGFYGQPTDDLAHLGRQIAEDPRFSLCTAQRVDGYLTQTPTRSVPFERAARWQQTLIDSGFSLKAMVREMVLSDAFATAGLQTVRPEQYARIIEDLTGFVWRAEADRPILDCENRNTCLGAVDLARTDLFGFRAMAGGIDGFRVTFPAHAPTPIKLMVVRALANEAAGFVVDQELAVSPENRDLLGGVTETSTDAEIRGQLVDLHARVLGQLEAPESEAIDATLALYETVLAESGPADAWRAVLSALLQDPRMIFY